MKQPYHPGSKLSSMLPHVQYGRAAAIRADKIRRMRMGRRVGNGRPVSNRPFQVTQNYPYYVFTPGMQETGKSGSFCVNVRCLFSTSTKGYYGRNRLESCKSCAKLTGFSMMRIFLSFLYCCSSAKPASALATITRKSFSLSSCTT